MIPRFWLTSSATACPTSYGRTAFAAIMSGLAGVKLDKWWKFIFPIFFAIIIVQAILMVVAVVSGFGA